MMNDYDWVDEADMLSEEDRQALVRYLHQGAAWVNFTKKSTGEERLMLCTLRRALIPQALLPSEEEGPKWRTPNPHVQVVFDLQEGAWRSFRLETVNWFQEAAEEDYETFEQVAA